MLVPPKVFRLREFASEDPSRYVFAGVRFERDEDGNPHAVSTDGRVLVHATWREPERCDNPKGPGYYEPRLSLDNVNGFAATITTEDCAEAEKLAPKAKGGLPTSHTCVVIEEDENDEPDIAFGSSDREKVRRTESRQIEGRFPDWRAIMPDETGYKTIVVNVDYLIRVAKLAKDLTPGHDVGVVLHVPPTDDKPLIARRSNHEREYEALIMPLVRS